MIDRRLLLFLCAACSSQGASPPDGGPDACACENPDAPAPPKDPLDPSLRPVIDTDPSHYPKSVWITDAMMKVRPTDAAGNLHWALLSAARGETESFQVHVHADAPVAALTVEVSDLKNPHTGDTLSAAANVVVSKELYLSISPQKVSDANGVTGEVPDALVPDVDPYFHEKRDAFPVSVAQGRNASAWIDVTVPAGQPSGWYLGQVTVKSNGQPIATMPILLKLWQVDLPPTATLRTNFGLSWNGACVQEYGGYAGCGKAVNGTDDEGVEYFHELYARFALDHRVSLADVVYSGPPGDDWTHFDAVYAPLFDGTAKTRLAGAKMTTIDYVGGASDTAAMARWAAHFKAKGWMDRLAYYHCDEPASGNGCTFAQALAEESAVHGVDPAFRTILTANIDDVTKNGLLDAVDVITPIVEEMQPHGGASQRPKYDAFLARSAEKRLYWYQSCDEHESCSPSGMPGPASATWPSYMADATPMRNRVFQWMAWMFDVSGELYYATDLCFQQTCDGQTDPLKSIYAFSGNGDGTLFYPGRVATIGGAHHVPLSSIRFELIREGLEDYELLAQSDRTFAATVVKGAISSADTFSADPGTLMGARETLGDRLHAKNVGR